MNKSWKADDADAVVIEIASEFASVTISKVQTRNGERIRISAPKLDREILLCPIQCESLTWQSADIFSEFLATPFGPSEET
jgi:hypothetical protein